MNVLDAALNTAHEYPHGGCEALSVRMGKSNLADELNPRNKAKFGLADAVRLQQLTGDHRILYAMAAELGHLCVPLPSVTSDPGSPCAVKVSKVAETFGGYMAGLAGSLADDVVSDNELAQAEALWGALVGAGQQMLKHMVAMNAAGKVDREGARNV
jgi:hypothetical protein